MDLSKQQKLKQIIKDLHEGVNFSKVQESFNKLIKNVSAEEIAEMEQSLITEGFPPEQIQKLCDVHVSVFEKSLKKQGKPHKLPGHPVHTYILENKACKKIIKEIKKILKSLIKTKFSDTDVLQNFERQFAELKKINIHYLRKENQLFPKLEEKGFTGPSKVMWGKHDEIRLKIKEAEESIKNKDIDNIVKKINELAASISNMFFMEERILFPTSLKKLSLTDWIKIKKEEAEIGYAWIKPGNLWDARMVDSLKETKMNTDKNIIKLDEGVLSVNELNSILKNLPFDISFVDKNNNVKYYSANKERIFPRSPAVIGRAVQNCHPPKSVHIVNKIIESFRKKEKDSAEFWINLHGKFVYIRYFPVYDDNGDYLGVTEITQDITNIKELKGEKRLLDWE
jgi:PAS domain S-box-containing protein